MDEDGRIDRLRAVGQAEFHANQREWYRLRQLADTIMDAMEYHSRQMDNWNAYLAHLAIEESPNVIELHPEQPLEPA